MTARDEIRPAARAVCSPDGIAQLADILAEVEKHGTRYKPSTIRTQVTSRLCVNAPAHHGVRYPDFEHVGPPGSGSYRLLF